MKSWYKALLIAALIWLVVLGLRYLPQTTVSFWPRFFNIAQAAQKKETLVHPSGGLEELTVTSSNGNITLIGKEEVREITVEAAYEVRAADQKTAQERLEKISTEIKMEGEGHLSIRALFEAGWSNTSISYVVTLPAALLVQAKTSNGRISATDLRGELWLTTSNGAINVRSGRGPRKLTARTSNGRIVVDAFPAGGTYNLRTSNGGIEVILPEDLGISLYAKTSNGSINVGRGPWLLQGGVISKHLVEAERGDGQLRLEAVTSNGSISIRD